MKLFAASVEMTVLGDALTTVSRDVFRSGRERYAGGSDLPGVARPMME